MNPEGERITLAYLVTQATVVDEERYRKYREAAGPLSAPRNTSCLFSISRDDLVFVAMDVERIERVAWAATDQEFRSAGADCMMTAAARRRIAALFR